MTIFNYLIIFNTGKSINIHVEITNDNEMISKRIFLKTLLLSFLNVIEVRVS